VANKNWARWIFASVADCLKQVAIAQNLPVLVEHLDERTETFMAATDRVEIRITGPFIREVSKGYYQIHVSVNVLLTSRYDSDQKNAYSILKYAGSFQEAMDAPISVWNFGGEPGDYEEDDPATQVFLGCLNPSPGRNESVRVLNFGQIDPVDKIKQTEVDARYVMELTES
jgi:hypothetical protein